MAVEKACPFFISSECIKSELDLFSLPPTETSIESSQWIYYKPVTSLADDSPIEFVIHGKDYLDLTHIMLSLRIRVESERGERTSVAPDSGAKVGSVNHLLHSMFNQIAYISIKSSYRHQTPLTRIARISKRY